MTKPSEQVQATRKLLTDAQQEGGLAPWMAYVRLSGPGWLQSAITLGGGSLAGSLFLGVLGGPKLLWLQLVAIAMGVIMLSAISYVTLSTGEKPFQSINKHINPVLGWGWLIATIMANMIWCMPQFSLCFAALEKNLASGVMGSTLPYKLGASAVILVATFTVVLMNRKQGVGAKIFDVLLKALVGMIVICFFGVVVYLSVTGELNWGQILSGFIPDFGQATAPTGDVAPLVDGLNESLSSFWSALIVKQQRDVMIGAAATAVGINMTFLLPYSMLNRGWDKPFRGLARFDLSTGMAIPYVIVTSCVVIAASASFHAKVDDSFKSEDPATFVKSPLFSGSRGNLAKRISVEGHEVSTSLPADPTAAIESIKETIKPDDYAKIKGERSDDEVLAEISAMASLSLEEKRIASSLVKRNAFQLSQSLAPLLGEQTAALVFGLGIFGMGFSTIIILMLINGYAFCEMTGTEQGSPMFTVGCLVSGISGAAWPLIWDGDAKLWLAILTSSFGMMLLPIAYCTFMMMMNSKPLMGEERPTGAKMTIWNVLMGVSVLGALAAAAVAINDKIKPIFAESPGVSQLLAAWAVVAIGVVFLILVVLGFLLKKPASAK